VNNLNSSTKGNNNSNNNSLNNSFGSTNSLDSADEGSNERRNSMDETSTSSGLSETEAARMRLKCKNAAAVLNYKYQFVCVFVSSFLRFYDYFFSNRKA